jgi:mono/diheme cytochrome c family protein
MRFRVLFTGVLAALAAQVIVAQPGPSTPAPAWNGLYAEAQADRGKALYTENCRECHGDANGTPRAPAIMGPAFAARWQRKPVSELFEYMQSMMPFNSPGGLSRTQNADILGFMLRSSGVAAGPKDFVPPTLNGEGGQARGLAFYTEDQASRGKFAFDRHCARCHTTAKQVQKLEQLNAPHTPTNIGGAFAASFGAPFLQRIYHGKPAYPNVYYLFDKLRNMPAFNTRSISAETRADIIAHILKQNDFPSGAEELRPEPELMKQMMLAEPGFERMFNGRDLTGIKVVYGPDCHDPAPKGCGKTDLAGSSLRVENGSLVCDCNIHGFWYTDKKYKDFDFRFEFRFRKPVDWGEGEDDELYFGGGGVLAFISNMTNFPLSLEIELRWHDLGDIFPISQTAKATWKFDHDAKVRAGKSPWTWNEMRVVSKGKRVDSYLNGVLVSTVSDHDFQAGHLGFQLEGAATEWRNVRVRGE